MKTQTVVPLNVIKRYRRLFESFQRQFYWTLVTLAIAGAPCSGDTIRCAADVDPFDEARRLAGTGSLTPFSCAGPDECALLGILQQWRDENLPTRTGASKVVYTPVCDEFECVACVGYQGDAVRRGDCAVVGCLRLHSPSLIPTITTNIEWSCVDVEDRDEMKRRTLERVDDLSAPPADGLQIIEGPPTLSGMAVVLVNRAGQVVAAPVTPGFGIFDLDCPPLERWFEETFTSGLHFRAQAGSAPSVLTLELELRSLNKEIDAAIVERAGCWKRRWSAQWPSHPRWEANEWTRVAGCKPEAAPKEP